MPSQDKAALMTGAEGVKTLPQLSITVGSVAGGVLVAAGHETVDPASVGSANGR